MIDTPIILIASMNKLGFTRTEGNEPICQSPRDQLRVRELCSNGVVVLSQKLYQTLPKTQADCSYVVVGEDELKHPVNADPRHTLRVGDLDRALEAAHRLAALYEHDKIVISGGSDVYAKYLYDAEAVHLTHFGDESYGADAFPKSMFSKLMDNERFTQTDTYTFYEGELQITLESYLLNPCIQSVVGDFVKLCNGLRFRLSQLECYMLTQEGVILAVNGSGVTISAAEMNLDRLLVELDRLIEQQAVHNRRTDSGIAPVVLLNQENGNG